MYQLPLLLIKPCVSSEIHNKQSSRSPSSIGRDALEKNTRTVELKVEFKGCDSNFEVSVKLLVIVIIDYRVLT